MGKAYVRELMALGNTYDWAFKTSIDALRDFVGETVGVPLIAIGSGGSSTAAHLAALLHRFHAGAFARHTTPLEIMLSEPNLHESAVLLLSASGKNRDVLGALERCVRQEVTRIATLCTQVDSPLASEARRYDRAHVFEADAPSGKDGFLATNSLLATCVFIARAYGWNLSEFVADAPSYPSLDGVRGRSMAVVLHGGWGSPVATDFESKLNESAIASAQLADYRNFGHGRHLWLARRAPETFVVALVTPETAVLAERTRALLPAEIPVIELRTEARGAAGTLELLVQAFRVVGELGELQGFDPGRPSVPDFGRKLYHLTASLPTDDEPAPVARKRSQTARFGRRDRSELRAALTSFTEQLTATCLGGLVLDYDGTLCGHAERFGDLRTDIVAECRRLIEGGMVLGIATGRGRSVRIAMQKALPGSFWDRVVVGYYNGGEIASLERDDAPLRDELPEAPLDQAYEHLKGDVLLQSCATFTVRRRQITIEPRHPLSTAALMSHVMTSLAICEQRGVRVLASSHSVDVLPPGVGKLAVVDEVKRRVPKATAVLCVGDRGAWPGNDCALLSHWPSLSVDEVSASMATCWNIAPPGMRGADVALLYLQAIRVSDGKASIDVRDFWRSR